MERQIFNDLFDSKSFKLLRQQLMQMDATDIAHLLGDVPSDKALMAFRLLPKDLAVQVFDRLDARQQHLLLESFTDAGARALLEEMPPDDRAELLDEVPAIVALRLIKLLSPEERKVTMDLLGYSDETAGRLMTPEFIDLRSTMTVTQAMERIRQLALERETVYVSYVIDSQRRLLGTVTLKDLVLADPGVKVYDVMTPEPRRVFTYTDQEEVAKILRDNDMLAVPVTDSESRLVGIVTWDDVVDILEEEATEDIYRFGAVTGTERKYFTSRILSVVKSRAVWLLLLILVNTITGSIIAGQAALLEEVVILAAFIPLLIGTGGNIGAQSATVVIRGLATGEINPRRAVPIILREARIGIVLGILLGCVVLGWAFLLGRDLQVAAVVTVTVVGISVLATLAGGALPFLFRAIKIDPAMVSAPFITTIMDIFGVVLYFGIAHMILWL